MQKLIVAILTTVFFCGHFAGAQSVEEMFSSLETASGSQKDDPQTEISLDDILPEPEPAEEVKPKPEPAEEVKPKPEPAEEVKPKPEPAEEVKPSSKDEAGASIPESDAVAVEEAVVQPSVVAAGEEYIASEKSRGDAREESSIVDTLMSKAVAFFKSGKYDHSEILFETVLAEDPYNKKAMEYLRRVIAKKRSLAIVKRKANRVEMLREVDKTWSPALKTENLIEEKAPESPGKELDAIKIAKLRKKMESIVIPEMDFREANIKDVVRFLSDICRRMDTPSHTGINFILLGMNAPKRDAAVGGRARNPYAQTNAFGGYGTNSLGGGMNADSYGAEPVPTPQEITVTLSLRNIPLMNALQYITEMAGLKFNVRPNVVTLAPVDYVSPKELVFRSYDIVPSIGAQMSASGGSNPSAGGGAASTNAYEDLFGGGGGGSSSGGGSGGGAKSVTGFFSGVTFPQGSSATYQAQFQKLFVRNTPENIETIERILDELTKSARQQRSEQVEIETKFVEVQEGALDELGFQWNIAAKKLAGDWGLSGSDVYTDINPQFVDPDNDGLYVPTYPLEAYEESRSMQSLFGSALRTASDLGYGSTAASMVFSKGGSWPMDVTMSALKQTQGADLLSSPKVVTKSGHKARISIASRHRFPQDFDVEDTGVDDVIISDSGTTGTNSSTSVRTAYVDYTDFEEEYIGVVLEVTPQVDAESGTIDLTLSPSVTERGPDDVWNAQGEELQASMPVVQERKIDTQVTVADGSTVVMGGLIKETSRHFNDKVPFLGDLPLIGHLFSSKGETSTKKNLLVFVRASMIDANGYRTSEREAVEKVQSAIADDIKK